MLEVDIPEVIQRRCERIGDGRGYFCEVYRVDHWQDPPFVQDNESLSLREGTLRGLHFQAPPYGQAKLLRCIAGRAWNVAVDLRLNSPTFGRYTTTIMSQEDGLLTFVPVGFAQGFVTLVPNTIVQWKVSKHYAPELALGIAWDDPDIGINWPTATPILSDRDKRHPRLRDLPPLFV